MSWYSPDCDCILKQKEMIFTFEHMETFIAKPSTREI